MRDGKDLEVRQMGTTWIERGAEEEPQKHKWNFASILQKKLVLHHIITEDEKSGIISTITSTKDHGKT